MSEERLSSVLLGLCELVSRLRGPKGCPWDSLQTDATVKMYLLEEAYEVLDAIEEGSCEDVCEELGDLLFQIIFLASLASERGEFDLVDVMEKITDKMVTRHPHVFGSTSVDSPEEVSHNWEEIKRAERDTRKTSSSLLKEVPVNLPALLRAHRLSHRAAKVGFDWENRDEVWRKIEEESEELHRALLNRGKERIGEEIGDLMFSLVNLARHWGLNAEKLLRDTNSRFINRFKEMEKELKSAGIDIHKATTYEMNRAWEKIKIRAS